MMSQYQPTTSYAPDADIVCLLKAEDPKGLQLLLTKYGGKVKSNLRHELGSTLDTSDIDEVLNRAAYLAWRHAKTYSVQRGKLGTWFYIIARNAALALLKSERPRNGRLVQDVDVSAVAAEGRVLGHGASSMAAASGPGKMGGEPSEAQQRFVACLLRCIADLPPLQRSIIRADLQTGEIADAGDLANQLGTSKNSIYVSRSSARKNLKRALERNGYFGEETGESLA